jgi:hypothetical protein
MSIRISAAALAAILHLPSAAQTDSATELRLQLQQLREQYEARLKALEQRIDAAEKARAAAAAAPPSAPAPAASPAPAPRTASPSSAPGLALSAVLGGTYAHLRNDPERWRLQGFIPGGEEIGPGARSFSLGESELTLSANVDPYFAGRLTFALTPDAEAEVEEAYVRTSALPGGLTATGGRFLSALGYQNAQHAHAWDFVDLPLAYQAFLGGQHRNDGVQLKWVAPTETYLELATELGNGDAFPGSARNRNGAGSVALALHAGGDWGDGASWRAGASVLRTKAADRAYEDGDVVNAFSGRSRTTVLDGVVKWQRAGPRGLGLKLQGEVFRRNESGTLAYDVDGAALDGDYRSRQSGWYLQGVVQANPRWRFGLREDRLRSGSASIGLVEAGVLGAADFPALASFEPRRTSAMVDYSLTEFSRLRLQVARERAQPGPSDRQIFLQYVMSLGAHGAHGY